MRVGDNYHRHEHAGEERLNLTDRSKKEADRRREEAKRRQIERETAMTKPTGYEEERVSSVKKDTPFDDARFGMDLDEERLERMGEVREDGSVLYPDYDYNSHPYGRDAMQVHQVSLPSYFFGVGTDLRVYD